MNRQQAKDVAKRAGWTFAQAFLAVFGFSGALGVDVASAKAAAIAGIAAVLSMLKSVVGTQVAAMKQPPGGA